MLVGIETQVVTLTVTVVEFIMLLSDDRVVVLFGNRVVRGVMVVGISTLEPLIVEITTRRGLVREENPPLDGAARPATSSTMAIRSKLVILGVVSLQNRLNAFEEPVREAL